MDNGNSVTEHIRVLGKDLSVTDNGDGTLTVIQLSTGNATVYDSSGKAIGRNPGQVRIEFVVDHNGTPDFPPDDILLSETLIKGSTGRSDDFCEVAVPALTSTRRPAAFVIVALHWGPRQRATYPPLGAAPVPWDGRPQGAPDSAIRRGAVWRSSRDSDCPAAHRTADLCRLPNSTAYAELRLQDNGPRGEPIRTERRIRC